jgi:hypothetical protein
LGFYPTIAPPLTSQLPDVDRIVHGMPQTQAFSTRVAIAVRHGGIAKKMCRVTTKQSI